MITRNGITTKQDRAKKGLRISIITMTIMRKIRLGIREEVRLFVISFSLSQSLMILVMILPEGLESKKPSGRDRIFEYASVLALYTTSLAILTVMLSLTIANIPQIAARMVADRIVIKRPFTSPFAMSTSTALLVKKGITVLTADPITARRLMKATLVL